MPVRLYREAKCLWQCWVLSGYAQVNVGNHFILRTIFAMLISSRYTWSCSQKIEGLTACSSLQLHWYTTSAGTFLLYAIKDYIIFCGAQSVDSKWECWCFRWLKRPAVFCCWIVTGVLSATSLQDTHPEAMTSALESHAFLPLAVLMFVCLFFRFMYYF